GLDACALLERLPRRQSYHRDRGRLHEVQMRRFERSGVLGHNRKLSQSARAQPKDTGEDGIARLEAGNTTTHLNHNTRQIAAQRGRQLKPQDGLHLSIPDLVIYWVQTSGVDLNENFVRLRHWSRNVSERDLSRSAITFEDKCSHVFPCLRFSDLMAAFTGCA